MSRRRPHAVRLLERVGVSDIPAAVVVVVIALLQYVFLWRLWNGYVLNHIGDVIAVPVVWTLSGLAIFGSVVLAFGFAASCLRSSRATAKLEKEARDPSFDGIRGMLQGVLPRTLLHVSPALLYTPRNTLALESRQKWSGANPAVVVGLGQREHAQATPDAFTAQLGHEISHLELGATGVEVLVRRCVAIHFLVFGWLVFVFALSLGFIDITGVASDAPLRGFIPIFDGHLYVGLLSQWVVMLLTVLVVFTYPYFYVVRREHAHDVRGSQLAATNALVSTVLAPLAAAETTASAIGQFFLLHPSARARLRVVKRHDVLLVSAITYPLITAAIQPLSLLLLAGWQEAFGVDRDIWNVGLTGFSGLLLYLVVTADLSRVGVGLLLDRWRALWLAGYALVAAVATQVPRLLLEISFGFRKGLPIDEIATRFAVGFVNGGLKVMVLLAVLLLSVGYARATTIAGFGFTRRRRLWFFQNVVSALVVVLAFAASSLSVAELQIVPVGLVLILLLVAIVPAAFARCPVCTSSAWKSVLLSTRCRCGVDRMAELRCITAVDYASQ